LAVLLIIGAGLFIPYRWMDKLVEQGKLELAKTEVAHVLDRHCQSPESPGLKAIPFATGPEDEVESRPITKWISLAGDQDEIKKDDFLRHGIDKFRKDITRHDYFKFNTDGKDLYVPQAQQEHSSQDNSERKSIINWDAVLPWNQPGRYLWALRADNSCISCHGSKTIDEKAATSEPASKQPPVFTEGELVGAISVVLPVGQTSMTLLFNRIFIIVGGLLSCICAVVVFYLITQRFILQPVRSLREAADQVIMPVGNATETGISEKESWQQALTITEKLKTGDEFEKLAQAFHQMLTRLKLAHDRLQETNRALDLQLGELEAKNIALYESNKLKSEFLANISHELRTPLNAIIGFAEILKEQSIQPDDAKSLRYVSNVLTSGKLLLSIINDLLDLARIEAGKMQVRWEKCSVREIAEAILNISRLQTEGRQLDINLSVDDNIALIETDGGKLQQILFNLFSNAVKFTPSGGRIDITARKAADSLQISVADTGPGIAEEDRDKIFEKFRQLDGSMTREHGGVGLGLAIVKELVGILAGTISVANRAGGGAVFTVSIPLRPEIAR